LAQDAGRSWGDAIELLSAEHPQHRPLIAAYRERWAEMLNGPIQGSVDVLADLRAGATPLYALTNWSAETFPIAVERYDFLGWFRDIVVSGREKMVKPDRRIYELLLARNGLDAGATVFIDDSAKNVEGARAVGMTALLFRSPEALRAELTEMGLLRAGRGPHLS
jgi:2-haloacid dehalogenase